MKRIGQFGMVIVLVLAGLVVWGGNWVQAHGDTSVSVTPISPKAGEEITVKGEKLGENATVKVEITGNNTTLDLGEVKSDQDGNFTTRFKVPTDLKAGTYKLKASADDESATIELTVLAGSAANSGATTTTQMSEAATIQERPLWETVLLVGFFGVLAVLGLFFAQLHNKEQPAKQHQP